MHFWWALTGLRNKKYIFLYLKKHLTIKYYRIWNTVLLATFWHQFRTVIWDIKIIYISYQHLSNRCNVTFRWHMTWMSSVRDHFRQHFPAIFVAAKLDIINETWGFFPCVFVAAKPYILSQKHELVPFFFQNNILYFKNSFSVSPFFTCTFRKLQCKEI